MVMRSAGEHDDVTKAMVSWSTKRQGSSHQLASVPRFYLTAVEKNRFSTAGSGLRSRLATNYVPDDTSKVA